MVKKTLIKKIVEMLEEQNEDVLLLVYELLLKI